MDVRVVLTETHLGMALRRFVREPDSVLVCRVGFNRMEDLTEWLVRSVEPAAEGMLAASDPCVFLTAQPAIQPLLREASAAVVHLPRTGRPAAQLVKAEGEMSPAALRVIGPGLPEFPLAERRDGEGLVTPSPVHPFTPSGRWSRTAGALGEPAWHRLVSLRYAVVGCGRTGSLIAASLARMGVCQLVLIDPDIVEPHNLDGDGYLPSDVGRPKAEALAGTLGEINPDLTVTPCAESVTSLTALSLLKAADFLLCCADNDGARWAAGLLAALYLKPLLDLGVGIHRAPDSPVHPVTRSPLQQTLGADIRLVIPGDACLACLGGVANADHVAATFRSRTDEESFQAGRNWRRERAGSFRSLNQIATGLGLRLVEDFVAGRVERSAWLRLEYSGDGSPTIIANYPPRTTACMLLCKHAGRGDGREITPGQRAP